MRALLSDPVGGTHPVLSILMRRGAWIVVGVVLVAVGIALLSSPVGGLNRESGAPSFSGVAFVEFDLENSPVEFTVEGPDTVVDYTSSAGLLGRNEVTIEQVGEVLHIDQDCRGFIISFGCQARFTVSLPADAQVSGVTSNGAIRLTDLQAPVDVATSNGAVTMDELTAPVTARTSNGSITGTGLESDMVDLVTSNGRVDLTFAVAPSSVSVRSSNGALQVLVPPDAPPYAVETSTSNGSVTTDIRTDPSAPDTISLRTSNGSITLGFDD